MTIGLENALEKIQYPFLIKNQNNKMAIGTNVLSMTIYVCVCIYYIYIYIYTHTHISTPKPATCPDLTMNKSQQTNERIRISRNFRKLNNQRKL